MELWNDFEGKTVDGRFRLDHLIGPKGRSAYFSAEDETGSPAMLRLIESLNDEDEILGRWRRVTGMKQEHLVEVLACGQTVLDGTHLVYAVMEPTEMELADVLRERALTADETRQIALSVADGLEALHARGLVHEHVEADNVLAKGETVKLRSDVAREAPEGTEGAELRGEDVRQLSKLLVYCLTGSRRGGEARLPGPFEEIVRKGESGAWGLKEIVTTLRPVAAVARPAGAAAPGQNGPGRPAAAPVRAEGVRPVMPVPEVRPATAAGGVTRGMGAAASAGAEVSHDPAAVAQRLANQSVLKPVERKTAGRASGDPLPVADRPVVTEVPRVEGAGRGEEFAAHVRTPRVPDRIVMEPTEEHRRPGLLIGVIAGFLLLVFLGVHFFRASRAAQTRGVVQDAVTAPDQSSDSRPPARDPAGTPVPQRLGKPSAAIGTGAQRPSALRSGRPVAAGATAAPDSATQWRVVAFTYNREDQAEQKVQTLAAQHPGLKPEVFTPSGRAPYLVTLGGWMSADRASALRSRVRGEGLPRDVYAQNYRGQGR